MNRKFIVIKTEKKLKKFFIDEILYCKADGAYSIIKTTDNKEFIVSKLLKVIENLLTEYEFIRINRSYLVNLEHCMEIIIGREPKLVLSNNEKLKLNNKNLKNIENKFCLYS
ncbi:MAG: LytTR family transcriptional regulator [Bacteroidales bacterium]|nr:LytTR family transcriptional regulator [Bacteroidales bacterium]